MSNAACLSPELFKMELPNKKMPFIDMSMNFPKFLEEYPNNQAVSDLYSLEQTYKEFSDHFWYQNTLDLIDKKIFENIFNIVRECSEEGWDGYKAKPVSPKSALYAFDLIKNVINNGLPNPELVPEPTGELGMLWKSAKGSLAISINDIGNLAYAGITYDDGKIFGNYRFKGCISEILLKVLSLFK